MFCCFIPFFRLNNNNNHNNKFFFVSIFRLFVLLLVEATLKMGDFCKTKRVVVVALVLVSLLSIVSTAVVVPYQDNTNIYVDNATETPLLTSLPGEKLLLNLRVLVSNKAMCFGTISIL